MKISFYGQSGFGIATGDRKLVIDPFITGNPLAEGRIDPSTIEADHVLVTHGHQDHVADVEGICKANDATLIANYEIVNWFGSEKSIKKAHPMNTGGQYLLDDLLIRMVHAVHSSSMPDGDYGGLANGYIVTSKEGAFYHAGDTALFSDMKLIGEHYPVQLAFLPIGDNFTMGIDDAVLAARFIGCDRIIGMHYDTFPPLEIDHEEAKKKFQEAGKELILMEVGETREIELR
jgi:L-ascorbate metabolism protein UlaG (beta-lactamase superfamily)